MAKHLLTDHEYQYQVTGEPSYMAIIPCTSDNSRLEEDGTITIFDIPNAPIAINKLRVRVKGQGINPPSAWLYNSVAFIETELEEFNFYISDSEGDDLNDGLTRLTAKKTYASALPLISAAGAGTKVGFKAGDVFNEEVSIPFSNIVLNSYDKSEFNRAAFIRGLTQISTGWTLKVGRTNVWERIVNDPPYSNGNGYDNVYVIEVAKSTETSNPFSSKKYLAIKPTEADIEATPGSFRVTPTDTAPYTIQLHTSDSSNPNSNPNYKYFIPNSIYAVRAITNRSVDFSNLIVQDAVGGYGPLAMNGKIRRVVAQGGSTHIAVIGNSADIQYCTFLNSMLGGGQRAIGLVVYSAIIEGNTNVLRDCIFFDQDKAIYTHASSGGNALSFTVERVHHYGIPNVSSAFLEVVSTDTVTMKDCYGEYTGTCFIPATGTNLLTRNVFYRSSGISYLQTQTSSIIVTNNIFAELVDGYSTGSLYLLEDTQKNIIHLKNSIGGGRFFSAARTSFKNIVKYNIIIAETNGETVLNSTWQEESSPGVGIEGTSATLIADYNVYINISGLFYWQIRNYPDGSFSNFNTWKTRSGQDQNSMFINLADEPLGLKKIFIDPENGDWRFTTDALALAIQAMQAGVSNPISSYPTRPTYEQAAYNALNAVPNSVLLPQ